MIRELRKVDINKVAEIWLDTNIKTHYFISAQYWKSNFELVTINEQIQNIAQKKDTLCRRMYN